MLNSTPAFIGGDKDGIRKANLMGRIGTRTEWTFRPTEPGTYTWGVQTIDAAYTGSTFTEGPSFTVTEEDGLTAISSEREGEQAVYNIGGQRMPKQGRGINVVNHRKVLHSKLR